MQTDYVTVAHRQLRDCQVCRAPKEKPIRHAATAGRMSRERSAERLPEAAGTPADAPSEKLLTIEDLARQFRVSTKTISRWRRRGLIGRRYIVDGRQRIGFLQSCVDRFVAENGERVRRGARFSQLSDEERTGIISRARCLAQAGRWPAHVTATIARETGRSVETIRYTLRRFNEQHPDDPVFPDGYGPPAEGTKRRIYQQHRRGESAESLSKRFCRSRACIERTINEMRARRIFELPLEYVPNKEFAGLLLRGQEKSVLGPAPEGNKSARRPAVPRDLPPYLASLYAVPLLTPEQEFHLFRKMNYLKYKVCRLREKLHSQRPGSRLMARIERLYDEVVKVKNRIIRSNLRLVVSIAKRHVQPTIGLFELISDGNMSLIRAVEKFDYARGYRFSTYASWAIMKNFARTIPNMHLHSDRFRTGHDELFGATEDGRSDQSEQEAAQFRREAAVARILRQLNDREREIIVRRFGLGRGQEPLTLKQVGARMGVTKERIRQLEARAIRKLRQAAEESNLEIPQTE